MSLAVLGVVLAFSIYTPYLIFYGQEVFDSNFDFQDCSGFFECTFDFFTNIVDVLLDVLQFLTLTGVSSENIDPLLRTVFQFVLGLVWMVMIIGWVLGSNQS